MSTNIVDLIINNIRYEGENTLARLEFERRKKMYLDELNKIGQTFANVINEFHKLNKIYFPAKTRREFLWNIIALSTGISKIITDHQINMYAEDRVFEVNQESVSSSARYIQGGTKGINTFTVFYFKLHDNVYMLFPVIDIEKCKIQVFINFITVFDDLKKDKPTEAETLEKRPGSFGEVFRRILFYFLTKEEELKTSIKPMNKSTLLYTTIKFRLAKFPRKEYFYDVVKYSSNIAKISAKFYNVCKIHRVKLGSLLKSISWDEIIPNAMEIKDRNKRLEYVLNKLSAYLRENKIVMKCSKPFEIDGCSCYKPYCFISLDEDVYGVAIDVSKPLLSRRIKVDITIEDIEDVSKECKVVYHKALNNTVMASVLNMLKELPDDFIINYDKVRDAEDKIVEETYSLAIGLAYPISK